MSSKKPIQRIMSVEIDSWADLFYLAQIMKFGDWVFRGHASEKWKLASSRERDVMPGEDAYAESKDPHAYRDLARHLNRPRLIGDEKEVIDDFRRLNRDSISDADDEIGVLATMQHYGTPTRLLDFSYSLGTALFFAYDRATDQKKHAIWAVRTGPLYEAVDRLSERYKRVDESDYEFWRDYDQKKLRDKAISLANYNIRKRGQGDWEEGVLLVTLPGNNKRLIAQNGLFLFPLTDKSFALNLAATLDVSEDQVNAPELYKYHGDFDSLVARTVLLKIVLPQKFGSTAQNVLRQMNLTPAVFFPGMEGIARTVRYR